MIVLMIVLLLMLALLLPVSFRLEAQHNGKTAWRATVKYAFLSRTWQSGRKASGSASRQPRGRSRLSIIRQADKARKFLLRHIRLNALDALILLHTGDAANSSLLAGSLQGIMNIPALPRNRVRIRILPDFFRGRTIWQARCIFHIRLGIILLTMLMLLASRLQQKARTAYGTSHW